MSAKTASRTFSSPSIIAPVPALVLMDIKHQTACGLQSRRKYVGGCGGRAGRRRRGDQACAKSALARRFQSLEEQREYRIDPRRSTRIAPFLGMAGMMEAAGGIENSARCNLDVGD